MVDEQETQEELDLGQITQEVFDGIEEKAEEGLEKPEEEQKEEEKPEESKTSLYAKLTAQDKELRQLRQQVKQKGSSDLKEVAKQDPMKALEQLGLGIDDILNAWSPDLPAEEQQGSKEDDRVSKLQEEIEKLRQEREQELHNRRLETEKSKIAAFASQDTSRWEIIDKIKPYDLVLDVAVEMYNKEGELPDMTDVLDRVEKYFEDSYSPLMELQKFRSKIAQQKEEVKEEPRKELKPQAPTLGATEDASTAADKELSEEERIAWAAQALDI